MKYIIILFLSLCHFITKAHDPAVAAKGSRMLSYMHFDGKSKNDTYIHADVVGEQDELIVDVDDDDNDLVSAKKHLLLVRTAILQSFLQIFAVTHRHEHKDPFCIRPLITSTGRYITQRALRI